VQREELLLPGMLEKNMSVRKTDDKAVYSAGLGMAGTGQCKEDM
jgi:hypothetical protein